MRPNTYTLQYGRRCSPPLMRGAGRHRWLGSHAEASEEDTVTDVPEEAVGRRILRLLAVERGLQDEGQGNAARLFRAAALGEALRATRLHPRLGRGLEQAATDIIAELRAVSSEGLAVLMDQALATVSSGGWPTLAQIPPTFVCRDCGEVMLGNPPPTCPVCQARALTFHEVGPFYWELLDVDHVLPALAAGVAEVEGICVGSPRRKRDAVPGRCARSWRTCLVRNAWGSDAPFASSRRMIRSWRR